MATYNIYIKSNEHPRTVNTPMMGRTNYSKIIVEGKEALEAKVAELLSAGETIREISTNLGTRFYVTKAGAIV